jgi:Domain of Unknown Function (DUF928)
MKRLQSLFSVGLVNIGLVSIGLASTIVALEILGLTSLMPLSERWAIAAPGKRPYRRASGAKRGVCPNPATLTVNPAIDELMAFLPEAGSGPELSATSAPSFYFYVPDQSEHVSRLEFRLDYASGEKRGKGVLNPPLNVPIANTPGIVKVQLPKVLEKSVPYAWSLTLRCQKTGSTVSFKGTVVYQDLDSAVTRQIAQASSAAQKAEVYQQAGFWLDAVPLKMETAALQGQGQGQDFEAMIAVSGLEKP